MFNSKNLRIRLGITLLLWAIFYAGDLKAQDKQGTVPGTYYIAIGDRVHVSVWQHPELSRAVVVDSKGNITLPSVGVVKAVGLPAGDLGTLLHDKLEAKISKPQVTVTVDIGGSIRHPHA